MLDTAPPPAYTDLPHAKLPPHSVEAEQSVLGGLLIDNQAWDKAAEKITEEDFYRYDHRLIFRAMQLLTNKSSPLDVITLSETQAALLISSSLPAIRLALPMSLLTRILCENVRFLDN